MDTVPHTYSVFNYVSLGAAGYFTVGMFSFFIYSVDISIISEYNKSSGTLHTTFYKF